jgi:flagellar secretion chaperone FliS
MTPYQAAQRYSSVKVHGNLSDASPHRLIQMLFEGALERIAQAKGAMNERQIARKGEMIGKAIGIVAGLRGSLNDNEGGELAANLDGLYDYIIRCLSRANFENDPSLLDECSRLLSEIKSAWDVIALEVS